MLSARLFPPPPLLLLLACTTSGSPVRAQAGPDDSGGPGDSRDSSADDSGDPAATPTVAFLSPADGASVVNPVTFTFESGNVVTLSLEADGYSLGEAMSAADTSSFTYTFNGTGYSRVVTLTGFDSNGNAVATDAISITVDAEDVPGVHLDVPYFYQMENAYEPSSTCGVTSGAMLVAYWNPDSVTPDSLYQDYGKGQGQSPSGLAAIYEAEGLHARYSLAGTRAELRSQLDAGRPVVVHGYFTDAGHIVPIVGYDDRGWIANDPAGDWASGYFNGDGEGVSYPYGGGWDDELGTDGDIWYSVADRLAF